MYFVYVNIYLHYSHVNVNIYILYFLFLLCDFKFAKSKKGGQFMKFKKLLASSLLCTLCMFSSLPVSAAEVSEPDTNIQQTEAALTDGRTRVSWGKGILTHQNPIGRKPWAYATTKTYTGKAHSIQARTKVKSGGHTDYTSWSTKSNATSVTSATIISRTEKKVKFNGEHRLQDTASSGWQAATTSASY